LNPPQHAAVFCVDEKTAIQALDRRSGPAPFAWPRRTPRIRILPPWNALSLYAALDTVTGRVHGKTTARHTSQDFIAFLKEVVNLCPTRQQIHIILDNLSAHKTALVREFLEHNPRVCFHFTPTYSSWLNQVELWFARIERDVIARGVFTSVSDLARKLRRYINAYSANARPIRWKYSDPSRRIRSNELSATGHLVVDWSLSCRLASAIEDAIIVLGIGTLFFYRNATALLLTAASAGALFLCAYWVGAPTHPQDRRVSVPVKNVRPHSAIQHGSRPRTKWL
jgi:transposase